ncbi:MAG TPA: hypothetical protein PL048_08975 [Leptospiraceae bacterium]|nr:hypothetical protein [Leptospiraceae bacterium]HMY66137.1 hypothetical protein [Leptospiraceae bacterium]HMZ58894.1 hypothetical protein [Leptospiraceae bacterium]HNF15486.1 hypothetical protein [Leptospiraceae bacterium]HNF23802.1 hypothetical protein [Leptospiraceae bacterium]
MKLDEIQGQETALQYLRTYIQNPGKIPPLLIFHGPSGTGKWSGAERFSFTVLCEKGTGCGHCISCKSFYQHQHPDYIQFPAGERVPIGDEKNPEEFTIRWLLSKRIAYQPHLSSYRIVLFPNAGMINNEAETALLKTLEEPPSHTRFIFITEKLEDLKQTILSRGVSIGFGYLSRNTVRQITDSLSIPYEEYFGGSVNPLNCPPEVLNLIRTKIEELSGSGISLIELENWIRNYKSDHEEWEENFSYPEFLEAFTAVLIHHLSKSSHRNRDQILEKIFLFKENIHKDIPGLDHFIISRLFFDLSVLV